MQDIDHIFIVGLGRTGSTLTRQILNSSDCIGIGGESHFFRDLPRLGFQSQSGVRHQLAKIGDLTTDEGTKKIVDHLFMPQQKHMVFWNLSAKNINRDEFLQKLLTADRNSRERAERSLFDLAMEVHANGKPVRGEKTPAHIFFVPELLEWFPNARVIHTFRDPRAIYASRKKKGEKKERSAPKSALRKLGVGFQLLSSLHVIINWTRVVRCHERYQKEYPDRYYLLKYEDLVSEPQTSLEQLSLFLQIELTEAMLEQSVINSSYLPDGAAGFDKTSINRWRKHMDPLVKRWFSAWCKPALREFGYQK